MTEPVKFIADVKKNKDCPKCHGESTLPEDFVLDFVWAGGVSTCPVCGGKSFWLSSAFGTVGENGEWTWKREGGPPAWDTEYYEAVEAAAKKADEEYDEKIRKRISDPNRLP